MMKPLSTPGARLGIVALAARLLIAASFLQVLPPAFAQGDAPRRGEPITLNFPTPTSRPWPAPWRWSPGATWWSIRA
jgi:hypothetical protein